MVTSLVASVQFSHCHVRLFATPWTAARQASLSITNSRTLPKFISIESVMPSNHLWWLSGKEFACLCRRHGFNPWVGKITWRRKWQLTPEFLPGIPMDRGARWAIVHGVTKSGT